MLPHPAYAAITLITGGAISGNATNGNDVTLTFPGGVQQGDVVILYGGHGSFSSSAPGPSTAGYTEIYSNTSGSPKWGVWYKVMGASPDANVVGQGSGAGRDATAYAAYIFRGVDSSVLDQTPTTAGPTASTNPDPPAITTITDTDELVVVAGSSVNDAAVTVPSGYTDSNGNSGNDTNDISTWGALGNSSTPGTYDPSNWTSWSSGGWAAVTIALKTAATTNDYGTPAGPASNTDTGPFRIMRLFEGFMIKLFSGRIVIHEAN